MVTAFPVTPRGIALTREQDLLASQVSVAPGASVQITAGPAQIAQLHFGWTGGAVHWRLYDGHDTTTGDAGWDQSWTSTSVPDSPWVFEIPFAFKRGFLAHNPGAVAYTVTAFGRVVGGGSAGAVGGRELPRSVGARMRSYMGVAPGSGVVALSGPGVLTQLFMRTTPGNPNSIVRSYDGLDKNGLFLDSNESLTNNANGVDPWVANGLRLKNGLFLSNEGTSPVDFVLVGTIP